MTQAKPVRRRCAVYTRKSSEEGLEQDFNSLHAQREACEAFIRSQAGEGWKLIQDAYDDGGLSGGTLERPALQRLMNDIRAGKIDTLVVYKVDRLTRSLADFAKIVELFDQAGVSFVAVTQQFNTTSSMGRLTLDILLSFAQFEREVTGERIRDKIAASKKKGMWMGGRPSLGYDVKDRKLVINDAEAKTVRHIFQRYLELESVLRLQAELGERGIVSKSRPLANGEVVGAIPLQRGALYALLANPIYVGLIRHKDACHPGQHEPIIDQSLWDAVQQMLKQNAVDRRKHRTKEGVGFLTGKIFDGQGKRLTPSYAKKGGRQYRYYVSKRLITGAKDAQTQKWRVPAIQIEQVIVMEIQVLLADQHRLIGALQEANVAETRWPDILQSSAWFCDQFGRLPDPPERRHLSGSRAIGLLTDIIGRVTVAADHLELILNVREFREDIEDLAGSPQGDNVQLTSRIPTQFRRRGQEMRLVVRGHSVTKNHLGDYAGAGSKGLMPQSDATLLKAIAQARTWFTELVSGESLSIEDIAKRKSCNPAYVQRLLPLAFLAPSIVQAIAEGRHPVELSIASLTRGTSIPFSWSDQHRVLRITV